MKSPTQRGVALVITLVMLAVVTFMAITFLALSRRERAAVSVTEEQTASRLMAEAALARAQGEVLSQVMVRSNLLAYDLIVSTNFINPAGLDPTLRDFRPTNVNYDYYVSGGTNFSVADRVLNIANLQMDPRPPVYVQTNSDLNTPLDFRFYLDLNRNGRFESNGWLPVVSPLNNYYTTNGLETPPASRGLYWSNFFVGDPEWIGVLEYPDAPHSATNTFVGRYAYAVLPAGKSLDWNYIHNHAARRDDLNLASDRFYRNQGFGSWELNLAGFLHDLNTNVWRGYGYTTLNPPGAGESFRDALSFLQYRYANNMANLSTVGTLFGQRGADSFRWDYIDAQADGPPFNGVKALTVDNDLPDKPWAGSDNPRSYFDPEELFDGAKVTNVFALGLQSVGMTNRSSYNRYTYYRLLAQIGMDSVPANRDKLNLNYNNLAPYSPTNFVPWTPLAFFTNAAERLILAGRMTNIYLNVFGRLETNFAIGDTFLRSTFSLTNISLYPTNEYTQSIHRLLQLAANLYDATTNRALTAYPCLPTVFRPTFRVVGTNVLISGFAEVTNISFLSRPFRDLRDPRDRAALASEPNANVFGVPLIIGAKKGFPNFNEFALQNVVQVTRKLEVKKRRPADLRPFQTNQMYMLSISNQFGLEHWYSYAGTNFTRPLRVRVAGNFMIGLTNGVSLDGARTNYAAWATNVVYGTNFVISSWRSNELPRVPLFRNVVFLPEAALQPAPAPHFVLASTNTPFQAGLGFYMPQWDLVVTNRFYYALVDETVNPARVVDFVSMGNMTTGIDVTREIVGRTQVPMGGAAVAEPPNVWLTNRLRNVASVQVPTEGVLNQMMISLGDITSSEQEWANYSRAPADGLDKTKSIDHLRMFVGETPLVYTSDVELRRIRADLSGRIAYQAGYAPTRKLYQNVTWQANDPLVHYLGEDLLDPYNRPTDRNRTNAVRFAVPPQIALTNSNLGRVNERYRPWGGNPNQSQDPLARDARVKDPLIERSDDWEFPTNKFPNLGWIGRVHRGTPWQTVYLKSGLADTNAWLNWAGTLGTHPTNDWNMLSFFTVAPNDNAARGLLGVNQTNLAAWSAVLSGVSVLTNLTPVAGARTNAGAAFQELLIQPDFPAWPQLRQIVGGLMRTRDREPGGRFNHLGRLLATPELTSASPFINTNHLVNDFIVERIPQQVLSLLKDDEPRFVVYAYGQALKPAANSRYLAPGPFNQICTNYQVRGEFATKSLIRIEGSVVNPRIIIESYNELPAE